MFRHWLILIVAGVLSSSNPGLSTSAIAGASQADKTQARAAETDAHLMGWWRMDETAGETAADSSGHARHATAHGGLSLAKAAAKGRHGGALAFDGANASLLRVSGYKGVTGTHPRTIAAWIKTASSSGEIVSWGANDFGKMWSFGFVRGRIGVSPKGGYLYMNEEIHDNAWHHVAVVMQEAAPPNLHDHVALYLDGDPAVIHDIGLLDLWPIQTGDELDVSIGRRFKGLIDDLRIFDRALSDEEILALFKLEPNRPSP